MADLAETSRTHLRSPVLPDNARPDSDRHWGNPECPIHAVPFAQRRELYLRTFPMRDTVEETTRQFLDSQADEVQQLD